jgi:ribosome-associated translation inhibitor RaiA
MKIAVTGHELSLNQQTRAYAESRVFSALAPYAEQVEHVRVVMSTRADPDDCFTSCVVEVGVYGGRMLRARGRALHAYAAVECAAQRMRHVMQRHSATRPRDAGGDCITERNDRSL